MSRAPRKYLDADRTEVSQEWLEWREDQRREKLRNAPPGFDLTVYEPGEKAIPEEGAWIIVIDPPITEQYSRFKVPLLSVWYARPHELNSGKFLGMRPQQAVIQTPGGDLHLWAREYTICSDPKGLLGLEGVEFVSLGGEPVLDEEQLFFLQSRGITREEASVLLFDTIKQPNYGYMTMPRYAQETFAGVGVIRPPGQPSVRNDLLDGVLV